jgi:hypothetical protein
LTEVEWQTCFCPYDMLRHLDGKIEAASFMRFSVACCRRIWPLIPDPRSRAVVEITEAFLAGTASTEDAGRVYNDWYDAYQDGAVKDRAGGNTHEAIECVAGLGFGNAAAVSASCIESAGYAASERLRADGCPQPDITAAWHAAEAAEKVAQCELLRKLFGYVRE